MADCKFCGKDAGWFKDQHESCKANDDALQAQELADAKSEVLATLTRGERVALQGAESFLLQPKEELLWVAQGGGYTEMKFKQTGQQRGWTYGQVHFGNIGVTTKRLLFVGDRSAQVALNRIISVSKESLNGADGKHALWALGVDTGAASRKMFVVDDPEFLSQLVDVARQQAGSGARGQSPAPRAVGSDAGDADLGSMLVGVEHILWQFAMPYLGLLDQLKTIPGVGLDRESLRKNGTDIGLAMAHVHRIGTIIEPLSGSAGVTDAIAAIGSAVQIWGIFQREVERLNGLGHEASVADYRDIEPEVTAAYTEMVKQIKRVDPGFEAEAAEWLAQKRRGDSAGARATLRESGPAATPGAQPVGTTISFKVKPAAECPTFASVGGMEDLKLRLRSTVGLVLRERQKAAALGIRFNGVLLYGPPGTGKTLVARACAGEFGCNLVSVGSADIMSAYVGDSPRLVSAAFETAQNNAPIILFFDEFDAIAGRRGGGGSDPGGTADRQVLEQLLRNLEGIRDRPDVIVMAATNRLEDLDPAVTRPGRFDLKVRIDLPDLDARAAIFAATLKDRKAAAIDCVALAASTEGLSAAAIVGIVDAAALAALQASGAGREAVISMSDLTTAIASRGGKDRPLTKQANWDDLVLPATTKQELQKIQVLIQDPARAKQFGVAAPRGVLLYGPPGTGKTSIARVLASETKASFYPMSCADLVSKWMGESEANVAQLFARARENRPSIIFLDELDAIARKRGDMNNSGLDRVLNQLLQEIDGLEGAEGVFVLAATNRREVVDEALLRGGRLGRQIYVGLPDAAGRETLLRHYAKGMPLAPDVDPRSLADATIDWSGADLRQLCEQAAMEAMMSSAETTAALVTADNFSKALETTQQQRGTVN